VGNFMVPHSLREDPESLRSWLAQLNACHADGSLRRPVFMHLCTIGAGIAQLVSGMFDQDINFASFLSRQKNRL
jgi:hypothetical protein